MLELYQAEDCPYCEPVRQALTDLGLSYVTHVPRHAGREGGEVVNEDAYEAMLALGEEDSLPFLVDSATGTRLHGDEAIVAHLRETYGDGAETGGAAREDATAPGR